jgi:hypothetical protein
MPGLSLHSIERILFDLLVAASLFMAATKVLVTEWKSVKELFAARRPRSRRPSLGARQVTLRQSLRRRHWPKAPRQLRLPRPHRRPK